jgi:hypothetical protein
MTPIQAIYRYVYHWGNTPERAAMKGRRCRVVSRGAKGSVLVEFENGQREVVSLRALRHAEAKAEGECPYEMEKALLRALKRWGPAFDWAVGPLEDAGRLWVTARRQYEGQLLEWKQPVDVADVTQDMAVAGDEIAHRARVKWWQLLKEEGESEAFVMPAPMRRRGVKRIALVPSAGV